VMRSLEECRHFLEGAKHKVEIWMDHKNLEYFMTAKKLNCRQAHWSLYLSRFDFVMHHCPGKSMGKCDALSRHADHDDCKGLIPYSRYLNLIVHQAEYDPIL